MSAYENLKQVAEALRETGVFHPMQEFDTVGKMVNALEVLNQRDKVYAFHETGLSLKQDLRPECLAEPITVIDEGAFEPEIVRVLDEAQSVISLWNRELSESDEEYIQEDKQLRGEDMDD